MTRVGLILGQIYGDKAAHIEHLYINLRYLLIPCDFMTLQFSVFSEFLIQVFSYVLTHCIPVSNCKSFFEDIQIICSGIKDSELRKICGWNHAMFMPCAVRNCP
jgi:hypothetical protein